MKAARIAANFLHRRQALIWMTCSALLGLLAGCFSQTDSEGDAGVDMPQSGGEILVR